MKKDNESLSFRERLETFADSIGEEVKEFIDDTREYIKKNRKKLLGGALFAGAVVVIHSIIANNSEEDSSNNDDELESRKLPQEVFDKLFAHAGKIKAEEWEELYEKGEITLEQATAQADMLESYANESHVSREIEPEEWPDAEDGWRP